MDKYSSSIVLQRWRMASPDLSLDNSRKVESVRTLGQLSTLTEAATTQC